MQLKSHYSPLPKHKPLLLLQIVLLHISSQIKCYSSQFLETPRAAEKHTRSSRAHWPSPGLGAAPPAERVTVRTATDGNIHTWTGYTQHGTCPAAQPTAPWCLINDIRTALEAAGKQWKRALLVNVNKKLIRNINMITIYSACSPWGHKDSDKTEQLNWTVWVPPDKCYTQQRLRMFNIF